MDINKTEITYFLSVLRCAIKGKKAPEPPQNIDWQLFLNFARQQSVFPTITHALDYNTLPQNVAQELNNHSKSELVRLIAMQNELGAIEKELVNNKIRYMLLKGSVIKNYYPKSSMRQMTDIDILYDGENQKKLLEIMKSFGYKEISLGGNSDDFSKKPFYTFEFHRELFKDTYGFFPDFSFVWDNAEKSADNEFEYNMSVEDLYLHHIAHMYKHYRLGGFGFRFLIDTYVISNAEKKSWNEEYINSKLKELKLYDFENLVRDISYAIIDDTPLNDDEIEFLNETVGYGLFGNKDTGVELLYEDFLKKNNNGSYASYVLSRLFPDRDFMTDAYPVLKEKPFLMNYYYIKRLLTKSKGSIKKAKKELKTVKKITETKDDKNINQR